MTNPITQFPILTTAAPVGSTPTATAGPNAISGTAFNYMRADGAPAVQLGSASQPGIVQVDGTTITASGGVISTATAVFPLRGPDGVVTAPSYSWTNETNSGWYRVSLNNFRYSIAGVDVVTLAPNLLQMGFATSGDATTFFYPTFNAAASHGYSIKINRLQIGLEIRASSDYPQSTTTWPTTYLSGAMAVANIACTAQTGAQPIACAVRSSDYRTAFSAASPGSGSYFFGLNDDTTGNPIVSALNPIGYRLASVAGSTVACQTDINNAGSVVDVSPISDANSQSVGNKYTAGALSGSLNNASAAFTIAKGANAQFRKGFVVINTALDTSIGTFGGGIFGDLPIGAGIRWMDGGGVIQNELGATTNGCGPINALKAGSLGIWPGIGDGGTIGQTGSITTAVTLNKICGQITTVSNAFVSGTAVSFTLNNTQIAATDVVVCTSGTVNMLASASNVASNSVAITIQPFATTTTVVTINFIVLKGTIT